MADPAVQNAKITADITPVEPLKNLIEGNKGAFTKGCENRQTYQMPDFPLVFFPQRLERPTFCDMVPTGRTGDTFTIKIAFRWSINLHITLLQISFSAANPKDTFNVVETFIPPKTPSLTKLQLQSYSKMYSTDVLNFCLANLGKKVGNDGQCGTFAIEALKTVSSKAEKPAMNVMGMGRTWGYCIYAQIGAFNADSFGAADIRPGDIIQFTKFIFKVFGPGGQEGTGGADEHTAIVENIQSPKLGTVGVIEQNARGLKSVTRGSYIFSDLVSGRIEVYRTVGADWGLDLKDLLK